MPLEQQPPANLNTFTPKPGGNPPPPVLAPDTPAAPTPPAAQTKPADAASTPPATPPAAADGKVAPAPPAVAERPSDPPAAPVEPAKEPEKAKEEDRAGKLLLQVRAQQKAVVEQTQRLRREQQEWEPVKLQMAQWQQTRAQFEQAVKADPLTFLERAYGITREHLASRILNDGKPDPREGDIETRRVVGELREELKALRQAKELEDTRTATQRELDQFAQEAVEAAVSHPHASKYPKAKLTAMGMRIARDHIAEGVRLTNQEILDKIEEELSETVALYRGTTEQPATRSDPPNSGKENAPAASTQPAPTLPQRAGEVASAPGKPADILMMTPEQEIAHVRAEIARLTGRKANGTAKP